MIELQEIQKFIIEANSTNSGNDKKEVIRKFKDNEYVKKIFEYTYSPFKQYHLSPANCIKNSNLIAEENKYDNIFDLLDDLNGLVITGHDAIRVVNAFILENEEYKDIIFKILNKNLETRCNTSLINKVIPNCIPEFQVALANGFDNKKSSKIIWSDGYYASRKLDGIRCVVMVDKYGNIEIKSRNGKEFTTFDLVVQEIKKLKIKNVVFDGEMCLIKPDGSDDFNGIIKLFRRKNFTVPNPRFKIFDLIPYDDFIKLKSKLSLSERLFNLNNILNGYDGVILDKVEQIKVNSLEELNEQVAIADKNKWEGIMLRKDVGYNGKRSDDLLKVKKFKDSEYIVLEVDNGPFRVIVGGKEITENVMRSVTIEHKGTKVSVGSGFSLEERRKYFKNPELILGKQITVQYFEESITAGAISLRFPVVKCIWENGKRDI